MLDKEALALRSAHCKGAVAGELGLQAAGCRLQANKPCRHVGSSVLMVLPLCCCRYGPEQGYGSFRRCLADFLTQETGHPVDGEELLITAGPPLPVVWRSCVNSAPHPMQASLRSCSCIATLVILTVSKKAHQQHGLIIHYFQTSTTVNKLETAACAPLYACCVLQQYCTLHCRCVTWLGPGLPPTGRPWRSDTGGVSNIFLGRQHPEASGTAAGESAAV
jgi:hypothetical protein